MKRSAPQHLFCAALLSAALGCEHQSHRDAGSAETTGSSAPTTAASASSSALASASSSAWALASAAPPQLEVPAAQIFAAADRDCPKAHRGHLATSPMVASSRTPLRFMFTGDGAAPTSISVRSPSGSLQNLATESRLGPPASAFARIDTPEVGTYRVVVSRGADVFSCVDVPVVEATHRGRSAGSKTSAPWESTRAWGQADEDLYSAWIEKLFDAPLSEQPSFDALYEVTSNPEKNFLYDHLGLDEDAPPPKGLNIRPDCADLPYTLRTYFAWKEGLPVGFSSCTRGSQGSAPTCLRHFSTLEPMDDPPHDAVRKVEKLIRGKLADTVHSGTGRTAAEDDATDYYPIQVSLASLRPGTIYADPYGHVLVVAKVIPQSNEAGGVLLAVDGQPDGTVGRKRFWEGNFLFSLDDVAMGSPGFKRFREVIPHGGELRLVPNRSLAKNPAYADFGLNQYTGGASQFYDLMDDVLSPTPRDPEAALLETVQALEEQVQTRLISVGNGEERFAKKTSVIDMPSGTSIFETTGEWEDFSTPSRDLRLLIAIDVATGFPARFERRPERYRAPSGKSVSEVKADLGKRLEAELARRTVTYTRSDGSPFKLSLAEVVARQKALEMAYNPNDCIETRWGAPIGSDEAKTCRRHVPGDQRAKMEKARPWFAERKRPARK